MALIKCPECGKEISDKAKSCPKCGYPINYDDQLYDDESEDDYEDDEDNRPTISMKKRQNLHRKCLKMKICDLSLI